MPSPFPGMDPFLEDRTVFPDFHDRFVAYLSETIQPSLPDPYYAALGKRAWVEVSKRFIGPDVNVILSGKQGNEPTGSTTATIDATAPVVVKVPHDEQSETLVEIYVGRGTERRLVTAIEVLSLTNKYPGEKGRDLYLRKQQELLDSKTHLVEIDFLRGGLHTTAVPEDRMRRFVPKFTWHVCAHHYDHFEDYLIWPIQLRDKLPEITIPLLPGDGEVSVCLQQVFERTYAAGPYHREIDYRQPVPEPEFTQDELKWVGERIAAD